MSIASSLKRIVAPTLIAPACLVSPMVLATEIIDVPGTSIVLKVWDAPDDGATTPRYAISLDGRSFTRSRATSYTIELKHGSFDPLEAVDAPAVAEDLAAGDDTNLYIVQFMTQPLEAFRASIRAAGGDIFSYLPNHCHVVKLDRDAIAALEALPFVRWVGPYHPAYRIEPELREMIEAFGPDMHAQTCNIQVARRGPKLKHIVAQRINELGGVIERITPRGFLLRATLTAEQIVAVARLDEVLYIDLTRSMVTTMNNVRNDGGANYVEYEGGYTGQGVRGEVMDTGLLTSHQAFQAIPPIIHNANSGDDWHGTCVYGICFGDGTGNANGRGMIPDAQGIFSAAGSLTDRYQHTVELVQDPYFAVFQTNSWGYCCTPAYTTNALEMDDIIFDTDLVILQAQGNSGDTFAMLESWAKNIVSVGGIQHENTLPRSDDHWSGSGSTGPAADGRIKPDLAYWYDSIRTTSNSGAYTGNFGGTSAATPMTAGHFGLMFQMWSDGIFGNPVDPTGTVFENRPHAATAKALMINSAEPYDFQGNNHDLARTRQGWGLANVANLYDRRDKMFIVDEDVVLQNLQSVTYLITVAPGEEMFKATMVYLDPPGNPAASQARTNDVTMTVTTPSGTVYNSNKGLLDGNWSGTGGLPNAYDTVENVFIQNPEPGAWRVEIEAVEIIADGHVETPALDADFALVVTGATSVSSCPADVNGDGTVDVVDLLALLAAWGSPGGVEDINGDGLVEVLDLLQLLASWGPC